MNLFSRLSRRPRSIAWQTILVVLITGKFLTSQCNAEIVAFNFTGEVYSITDHPDTNVFKTFIGDELHGYFIYDAATPPTVLNGTIGVWSFPITSGGWNQFMIHGQHFYVTTTDGYSVVGHNNASAHLAGNSIFGVTHNPTGFDLTGISPDLRNDSAAISLSFLSVDSNLSTLPNLPTQFEPLSQWDYYNLQIPNVGALGTVQLDFYDDATDAFIDSSTLGFRITSISAIPEPSSIALLAIASGALVARLRCKKKKSPRSA